jgi:DNA modification methylase
MMAEQRIIEHIKLSGLKTDPSNPNRMTRIQLEALKKSIQEFGNLKPIIIDQDNNILDGEQRFIAYSELQRETIESIRVTIRSDADKRIVRQLANKLHGTHDPEKDAAEFVEILKQNMEHNLFDVSAIKESEFYRTIGLFNRSQEKKDIIPEVDPASIETKLGDVWQCGDHRIMCANSTNPEHWKTLMGDDKAHIVITDPPYGVDYVAQIEGREGTTGKWKHIQNDELKGHALQEFCEKFLTCIQSFSTDDSAYYIFFGMKTFHHLMLAMDKLNIYYALPIIWSKSRPTISWAKYHPDYEVCAYGGNGSKPAVTTNERKVYASGANRNNYKPDYEPVAFSGEGSKPHQARWYAKYDQTTTWFEKPDASTTYLTPTMKPVALAERALMNSSREGEICVDCFAGSGFTLIACHKLKRVFRGMELEPLYVETTVRRWENYSGMKAKRIPCQN